MKNPYGYFDDARREYVIVRPDTPLPWINYLGCQDYLGIISNTAGGYSFYRDARLRRITRYRYNNVPLDSNGRYVYIKDDSVIWNPGWKPTRTDLDEYGCRHGLGYTVIQGRKNDVVVTVRYFVPLDTDAEIWDVQVENWSRRTKHLKLWGYLEWCLWEALDDMTNFQRNFSTGQVEVEPNTIFHVTEYRERRNHFAYFSLQGVRASGFDIRRDRFVGVHNGLETPQAVVRGRCTGEVSIGWAPIAAHQVDLELAPRESKRFHFVLGYCENSRNRKWERPGVANKAPFHKVIAGLRTSAQVDAAFERLGRYWQERLNRFQVEVPNEHVQRMVNIWNQYQCMVTLNLSRSASLYESGIGRGMGFRDSNQDVLGFVHLEPERARQRLLDLAATQCSDGTCYHQFQPLTKKGNTAAGSGFNDDPLWLPISVVAYINETGDISILKERIGYADLDNRDGATLLDHLETSIRYTLRHLGPHGLPLIGHADWNDCLNLNCFSEAPGESFQLAGDVTGKRARVAESVMIAGQFCVATQRMAEIYRRLGQPAKARQMERLRGRMQETIRRHAWDGAWFRRAYDAFGRPVGSKKCKEGKIFIESQGWCIMGGVGQDDGKARMALDSVKRYLATPNGIVLQQPAYSTYQKHLGEITSYPPGYKENAGIFTHNNTWIQIAEAMLGRGDRAMEYYLSVCPSAKESQIDIYRCEPYVYAQMTAGPDAPTYGEAKNSWLTGTAAWSFVVISQYILGIRPTVEGLRIDPCIPRSWKEFSVRRWFRGKVYEIRVRNPQRVCKGVRRMVVDGRAWAGDVIPAEWGGKTVRVEVEMGRTGSATHRAGVGKRRG